MPNDETENLLRQSAATHAAVERVRARAAELIALPLSVPIGDRLRELLEENPYLSRQALRRGHQPSIQGEQRHLVLVTDSGEEPGQPPSQIPAPSRATTSEESTA